MAKAKTIDYGDWVETVFFYGLPALSTLFFFVFWASMGVVVGMLAGMSVVVVWMAGFTKVDTTERAVKIFIGYPYATAESGLRWIVPFLGSLDKRPTTIQELEFPHEAGIITRSGKARDADGKEITNGRGYGSTTIGAKVSLLFQYPKGDALIKSVINLPAGRDELINLFEEPVLDQVRTVGGDEVWINLVQRRAHFAKQVLASIKKDEDGVLSKLLFESGLDNSVQIAIKHLVIPEELKKAVNAQETAEQERAGTVISADAERQKLELEGQGRAQAKKKLLDVIREHPENKQAQALLTLIEMAQGPATTIFPLSTDLTNVLGQTLGRGKSGDTNLDAALALLTASQRQEILKRVQDMLKPGGVK